MTITNYTSVKRELLKRLVELMGGKVSGEMNRQTKYVIAARKEGKKVQSAIQWNTPVLNHKWLTECCARWNLVDPVNYEPGRTFPPGLDYQNNMISDLPQDAVAVWAESSLAMESKKQASEFLEYARAQTKKTQNPVPESLDISDTGSESEASAMNGDVSGRSNTLRPTGSTPAHIQDQLVPREKSSSKKLSPFKSSPAVFDSENSGKKANKASKVKPTPKGRTSIAKKPALSDDDEADELPSRIHSSGNKRAAAVAGADKNRVNALDMNAHEKEKKRKRFQEIDGLPSEEEPPTSSKKPRGTRKASSSDDSSAENDLSAAPTYTSKNGKQNFSKKSGEWSVLRLVQYIALSRIYSIQRTSSAHLQATLFGFINLLFPQLPPLRGLPRNQLRKRSSSFKRDIIWRKT